MQRHDTVVAAALELAGVNGGELDRGQATGRPAALDVHDVELGDGDAKLLGDVARQPGGRINNDAYAH